MMLIAAIVFAVCAAGVSGAVMLRRHLARSWVSVLVCGNSMAPSFRDGQRLMVRRRGARPARRHDVIVFSIPAERVVSRRDPPFRIKRVSAVTGDPVPAWAAAALGSATVPPAHVVVSGDNQVSQDSRQLGFIPEASIVAIVDADPTKMPVGNPVNGCE